MSAEEENSCTTRTHTTTTNSKRQFKMTAKRLITRHANHVIYDPAVNSLFMKRVLSECSHKCSGKTLNNHCDASVIVS